MNVDNIKANGVSYHTPAMKVAGPTILTAIKLYRMRYTEEEIFEQFPYGDNYHPGTRFNDDESVLARACSAITKTAINKLRFGTKNFSVVTDEEAIILEQMIEKFIDDIRGLDMDKIISDSMRDCASSDHWYTFEKEW